MGKMSQDAKKDEFRKYLEKAGVLELLTKSLVSLYEEPEKPTDALSYLKNTVGGSPEDKISIKSLQEENEELKKKVTELEASQDKLKARITELETPSAAATEAPAAEKVAMDVTAPVEDTPAPAAVLEENVAEAVAPAEEKPAEVPAAAAAPIAEEPMETEAAPVEVAAPVVTEAAPVVPAEPAKESVTAQEEALAAPVAAPAATE